MRRGANEARVRAVSAPLLFRTAPPLLGKLKERWKNQRRGGIVGPFERRRGN